MRDLDRSLGDPERVEDGKHNIESDQPIESIGEFTASIADCSEVIVRPHDAKDHHCVLQ